MNVPVHLLFRTKMMPDLEDIALTFIEEELGRHDWINNWKKLKEANTAETRITAWLKSIRTDYNAKHVVDYIDRLVLRKNSKWIN